MTAGEWLGAAAYSRSAAFHTSLEAALKTLVAEDGSCCILVANNAQCFIPVARTGAEMTVPTVGVVRDTQVVCESGACVDGKRAETAAPCRGLTGAAWCKVRFHRVRGDARIRPVPGWLLEGMTNGLRRRRLRVQGLYRLDRVVAISDALQRLVRKLPGADRLQVAAIRNFRTEIPRADDREVLEFLEQQGLEGGKYFLMAGRKTYGKGADLAVAAMREVALRCPGYRLLLAGWGFVANPRSDTCIDVPPLSQSLLLGLLNRATALLIPGRWQEGLHRTMIDALFMGIPVICSEAGAPRESVEEQHNGYVVPCNDVSALADAMEKAAGWQEREKATCRVTSRRIFEARFADSVLMGKWRDLFGRLLQRDQALV